MHDLQKDLLSVYPIEIRTYANVEIENIPKFLKQIDKITSLKEDSIIQLLDADNICGTKHIRQGISQAIKAFNEKQNFAKDRGLEICVRTSAQKQIRQTKKMLGIKSRGNITAVYINTTSQQVEKTEETLTDRKDNLLESYDEDKIIEIYELGSNENIVDQINEKIALLALKN